ncbi:fimbria/pilus outer membrane usher protein [Cupriavidus basilensis]
MPSSAARRLIHLRACAARVDANISQQLGASGGSVYLNGSSLQYWNQRGQALSFTLGCSNQWRGNTYSVSVQRVQNAGSGGALYGGAASGNKHAGQPQPCRFHWESPPAALRPEHLRHARRRCRHAGFFRRFGAHRPAGQGLVLALRHL